MSCLTLSATDYITAIGIVVNSILAFWIVNTIQNNVTNKRTLKDHFIEEIKEIRNDYKIFLTALDTDTMPILKIIPWFKLMNIKVEDVMALINEKYEINSRELWPYQNDLRDLITNNQDYINQFRSGSILILSEPSKTAFVQFQQTNSRLFNRLIIGINDHN